MKKAGIASAAVVAGVAFSLGVAPYASAATDSNTLTEVQRIWGQTRVATSIEAANQLDAEGVTMNTCGEVFIVGGESFPDPLALTPLADAQNSYVFMTQGPNDMPDSIIDRIKGIEGVTRVTVIGLNLAVSDSAYSKLYSAMYDYDSDIIVSRIGGQTRYETSYYLAAEASAAAGSGCSTLGTDRDAVASVDKAEWEYQQAVSAYETARANYAAAERAFRAGEARYQALLDQIDELVSQLQSTSGPSAADLAAAKDAVDDANAAVTEANDARTFFTSYLGTLDGASTLDIKSTLAEYRAILSPADDAKLTEYSALVGATDATTLEEAIGLANNTVDAAVQDRQDAGETYAELVRQAVAAAAANTANQPLLTQIAALQTQANALSDSLYVTQEPGALGYDLQQATDALTEAQQNLVTATENRPAPGDREQAVAELTDARDAAVRGFVGSAFVANGADFPDPLVGGPAAAQTNGVVLLSQGTSLESWTRKFLDVSGSQVVTVGIPAANAVRGAATYQISHSFEGQTRYDTAAAVTSYYFGVDGSAEDAPIAIASGEYFHDAVLAGNFISQFDGGVLLTRQNELPIATNDYLSNTANRYSGVRIFGGPLRVSDSVVQLIENVVDDHQ